MNTETLCVSVQLLEVTPMQCACSWPRSAQVRALATVDVLVAPHAWPLLTIASLFLPKGAAIIEVRVLCCCPAGSCADPRRDFFSVFHSTVI